jgi:glycerol-3-phosphate O-acyltransferase
VTGLPPIHLSLVTHHSSLVTSHLSLSLIIAGILVVLVLLLTGMGRRHARTLHHARRIHLDRFKLKNRHALIRLEVFASEEVVSAVKLYARENHVPVETARQKAGIYLNEILPKFNLLAYYRFGAPLARLLLHFLYRVVVEQKVIRRFNEEAPRGAVVVYVINHRSNADYVLVAHLLFKFISLSYAVGEWARVWPLNHLFKWFGAYFIRRHFREPLYHAVLRSFIETITRNGVTQGIFIEGGLTRDGAFQRPKLGMLDYIVGSKASPDFTAPLFLIPTALNLDRTLEDRHLSEELSGKEDRSTRMEKLRTTFEFLFKNALRSVFRRFKRYGYAAVSFGQPILVDDFIRSHPDILARDYEVKKPHLQALAEEVMTRISEALPLTPVPVMATLFRRWGRAVTEAEILQGIEELRLQWADRNWILRDRAAEIWNAAREVLTLRHLLVENEGRWSWNPAQRILLDYYASSLVPFSQVKERGWPVRK